MPPSPTGSSIRELIRDPLNFFQSITAQYGDVVCYRPAPDPAYLINHPDYVRHVILDNNRNYSKATHSNLIFNKVIGEGLLTSEGEVWRKQRRMMQPAFHHTRLEQLDEMITQATAAMLEQWQSAYEANRPIDLPREMAALTLTVTTRALFGVNLGDEVREVGEIVNRAANLLEKPSNPRLIQSAGELKALVDRIIQQRRRDFQDAGDLLSSLILARDEHTGAGMSDEQLRSQILTLMLAGYETTASALTWTWYLLSKHPWAVEHVRSEVREALGGRPPRYADIEKLPYTRMVLNESLRLYPPGLDTGTPRAGRRPDRRVHHPTEHGHCGVHLQPAQASGFLGRTGSVQSGAFLPRELCRTAQVRIHPIWGGAAAMHRQQLWADGGVPDHRLHRPMFRNAADARSGGGPTGVVRPAARA